MYKYMFQNKKKNNNKKVKSNFLLYRYAIHQRLTNYGENRIEIILKKLLYPEVHFKYYSYDLEITDVVSNYRIKRILSLFSKEGEISYKKVINFLTLFLINENGLFNQLLFDEDTLYISEILVSDKFYNFIKKFL